VFKTAGIIFCTAIFLAGCTVPNAVHELPPSELPGTNAPQPMPVPLSAPPAQAKPAAPMTTWGSLNRWAVEHGLTVPLRLSDSLMAAYSIRSKYGVMVLEIGNHETAWNGVQIYLGFAPQLIDGEMFLHGLDLQKNLEPLLCGPPLAFGTNRVIVIDPGHGGSNTGTHSVLDGRFEKEFTLDTALHLKPLLETNGWTVFLTRTNDTYVSLSDRVAFAEAHHAALFISLHFNSAGPDTNQAGLETYCLTPTGMPSTVTRDYSDIWSESLQGNHFDAQNLQLAVRVHSALLHAMGMEDRGVRRARFITVLRGQNCPAILIEAGYLSNPTEAKLIESAEYRQKLAESLAAALK
jgi:N-acetylmuramoyl-L-alanine amidase